MEDDALSAGPGRLASVGSWNTTKPQLYNQLWGSCIRLLRKARRWTVCRIEDWELHDVGQLLSDMLGRSQLV